MIERVKFVNFKALRDVTLDLGRFTVLVGPNGSGKTSVLEGLKYVVGTRHEIIWHVLPEEYPPSMLRTSGIDGPMGVGAWTPDSWGAFGFGADWGSLFGLFGDADSGGITFRRTPAKMRAEPYEIAYQSGWIASPADVETAQLLRLEAARLAAPSYSAEAIPSVDASGEGLASVLAHLMSNGGDAFGRILDGLKRVIPNVSQLRCPRAVIKRTEIEHRTLDGKDYTHSAEKEYGGNSIEFDMEGAAGIPASMMSEGTLLVLGLLTVILGPNHPRLLLLDDIDRALHPKAQKDLVGLLRKLMEQYPDIQIVATSHSPYLLDHLAPEEIRLTTLKDDGSVAAGRLDEHPEFDKWKETMTPGEFWSLIGEHWLVEAHQGEEAS